MNRVWVLSVGLVVGLTGCVGSKPATQQSRGQVKEDAPADPDAFATVGMKTMPSNTEPIQVSGVGLVYRLQPGAGSSAPPGSWRQMLEGNLRKQQFTGIKELLDDPNRTTSLVLVSALIPPGARKGDPIDLQITVPDECKTRSLKGGILFACDLVNFDTTGNLTSITHQGRPTGPQGGLVLGSTWAKAEGPLVAGVFVPNGAKPEHDARTGEPEYRVARVWGGGRVVESRPYFFLMNPADQTIRMAAMVAERLNATFDATADPKHKIAQFKSREVVLVNVPAAYRHNHHRFLLVARQVPLVPVASDSVYRRKLEEELLEPATALTAAIRLEALGGESRRALRVGLESPSPWVRFAAAEALAYLGQTDGTGELAKLAEEHPALRAHCLKALASMDDASSTGRLAELMASADPELRYGAFVALRLADESSPTVRGVLVNKSYWMHRLAPGSPGMVHLTTDRRSEVLLFGDGLKVKGPFTLPVGTEFTVSLPEGQTEATVTRIVRVKGELEEQRVKCPANLPAVLAAMARLGARYPETIEFLRRADRAQVLGTPLVTDAIPREFSVQQLAAFARTDPGLVQANAEVAKVGTVRPNVDAAGFELPADHEPTVVQAEPPAPRAPLSRDPGRIFSSRKPPEPKIEDPLTPVTPAVEPASVEVPEGPRELSREPGRLFGPKK